MYVRYESCPQRQDTASSMRWHILVSHSVYHDAAQFPDVSRPETLEKRYLRRMSKLQMQLLKASTLQVALPFSPHVQAHTESKDEVPDLLNIQD